MNDGEVISIQLNLKQRLRVLIFQPSWQALKDLFFGRSVAITDGKTLYLAGVISSAETSSRSFTDFKINTTASYLSNKKPSDYVASFDTTNNKKAFEHILQIELDTEMSDPLIASQTNLFNDLTRGGNLKIRTLDAQAFTLDTPALWQTEDKGNIEELVADNVNESINLLHQLSPINETLPANGTNRFYLQRLLGQCLPITLLHTCSRVLLKHLKLPSNLLTNSSTAGYKQSQEVHQLTDSQFRITTRLSSSFSLTDGKHCFPNTPMHCQIECSLLIDENQYPILTTEELTINLTESDEGGATELPIE